MATHSRLGDIEFRGINSILSFQSKRSAKVSKMQKVSSKDTLQKIGNDPDEISFSWRIHTHWMRIDETLELVKDYTENGTVLEYTWGNGQKIGDFVITEYDQLHEAHDPNGNLISVVLTVSMVESFDEDFEAREAIDAKANAFAADPANTIPILPVRTGVTTFFAVSQEANSADISARKSIEQLEAAVAAPSERKNLMARANDLAKDAGEYVDGAIAKAQNFQGVYERAVNLESTLDNLKGNLTLLSQRIEQGDFSNALSQGRATGNALAALQPALLPLNIDLILRNG